MKSIRHIYKIGRGPSSSHTMGPVKAAEIFLARHGDAERFEVTLFGSLAKTGKGHGTDTAIIKCFRPKPCEVIFDRDTVPLAHENTLELRAFRGGECIGFLSALSVGGGDIVIEGEPHARAQEVYAENTFDEVAEVCRKEGVRLPDYAFSREPELRDYLAQVWDVMRAAAQKGVQKTGTLPGGLGVQRRANALFSGEYAHEDAATHENRLVCAYAEAYERIIRKVQPRAVIVWCQFTKLHPLCAQIAQAHGAKVLYMEFGSIPGTFALEDQGQMGESRIATEWESFLAHEVSREEIARAGEILDFLRESGLNRNRQTELTALGEMEDKVTGRPLVIFAGQNDFDSGLIPYDEHAREHHSPAFRDSLTAAEHIAAIAEEEGWDFAYKPHPFMAARGLHTALPVITRCNFNAMMDRADVIVTGVSQSSYVACIRRRPCVAVGYNQLRGKGCLYEAADRETLRETLRTALREGCSERQQAMFRMHTAQLLKYALYDDLSPRDVRYGRSPVEAAAWLLKEMNV